MFNTDRPITQSTVSKLEKKIVEYIQNAKRPKVLENVKRDVALTVEDNPHNTSRKIAAKPGICRRPVLHVLKTKPTFCTKFSYIKDSTKRIPIAVLRHFQDLCSHNSRIIKQIIFFDQVTFC